MHMYNMYNIYVYVYVVYVCMLYVICYMLMLLLLLCVQVSYSAVKGEEAKWAVHTHSKFERWVVCSCNFKIWVWAREAGSCEVRVGASNLVVSSRTDVEWKPAVR